ncbi:hypothetical protein G7054_g9461 [Neopestalotiopsis clavispora]|nr:hypothetical protein G7054_g9461 [Neopestalotiopsis clavispora]
MFVFATLIVLLRTAVIVTANRHQSQRPLQAIQEIQSDRHPMGIRWERKVTEGVDVNPNGRPRFLETLSKVAWTSLSNENDTAPDVTLNGCMSRQNWTEGPALSQPGWNDNNPLWTEIFHFNATGLIQTSVRGDVCFEIHLSDMHEVAPPMNGTD